MQSKNLQVRSLVALLGLALKPNNKHHSQARDNHRQARDNHRKQETQTAHIRPEEVEL